AALKNLTSDLIGHFCTAAERATHERYGAGPLARYAADLVVPGETVLAIAILKGIAAHFVMRAADRMELLAQQQQVIKDLVAALSQQAPSVLEPAFRHDYEAAGSDEARLRVIVDQIASLTD